MFAKRLFSGDPARSSILYLGIGIISLVKAIVVRDDPKRFRRELLDAGLFLGVGLVLRRYGKLKSRKRAEIEDRVPSWMVGDRDGSTLLMQRFGRGSEPESTLRERARNAIQ
jgi:hypothetical protein